MIRNCRECDQEFSTECELPEEGSHLCPTCSRRLQIAGPALLDAARLAAREIEVSLQNGIMYAALRHSRDALHNAIALAEGPPEPTDPYLEERVLEQQELFEERKREVAGEPPEVRS